MVKVDYFDIEFDVRQSLYLAGQPVRGTIVVSVPEPLRVAGIFVSLIGEAKTSWVNKVSDKIYETVETYINDRVKIPYLEQISDGELLMSGAHSVPFVLHLPMNLPSSYDGDFGYIRYKVVAGVQLMENLQKELISEKIITILAVVRPENVSKGQASIGAEENFEVIECCSARGSVHMAVSVDKPYCIVGRPIVIDLNISNRTRSKKTPSLILLQEAFYQSKSRYESVNDSKTLYRVIESVSFDPIEPGKSLKKEVNLEVPTDLPPTSTTNALVTLKYRLKLDVGNNFEIILPIGVASVNSSV